MVSPLPGEHAPRLDCARFIELWVKSPGSLDDVPGEDEPRQAQPAQAQLLLLRPPPSGSHARSGLESAGVCAEEQQPSEHDGAVSSVPWSEVIRISRSPLSVTSSEMPMSAMTATTSVTKPSGASTTNTALVSSEMATF